MTISQHPATKLGAYIQQKTYDNYIQHHGLANKLGMTEAQLRDLLLGKFSDLSEDQLYLLPYFIKLKGKEVDEYYNLLEEAKAAPKLNYADIVNRHNVSIAMTAYVGNVYVQFELDTDQRRRILDIVLGKETLNEYKV